MKKTLLSLVAVLVLAGAGCSDAAPTTTTETDVAAEPRSATEIASLVDGLIAQLHTRNSQDHVFDTFPDATLIHEWAGPDVFYKDDGTKIPSHIFPFRHYYSAEADTTFVICNINRIVAVCPNERDDTLTLGEAEDCTIYESYDSYMPE